MSGFRYGLVLWYHTIPYHTMVLFAIVMVWYIIIIIHRSMLHPTSLMGSAMESRVSLENPERDAARTFFSSRFLSCHNSSFGPTLCSTRGCCPSFGTAFAFRSCCRPNVDLCFIFISLKRRLLCLPRNPCINRRETQDRKTPWGANSS